MHFCKHQYEEWDCSQCHKERIEAQADAVVSAKPIDLTLRWQLCSACGSQTIPRSALPGLPEGVLPPFGKHAEYPCWIVDSTGVSLLSCINESAANTILALLKACYEEGERGIRA